MDHKTTWLEAPAIITASHEDCQADQADILRVLLTPRPDTIIQIAAKVAGEEVTAMVRIHPKEDEVVHMVQVTCQGLLAPGEEVVVVIMVAVAVAPIFLTGVNTVAEAQT